jgi:MFS family permease
VPGYVQLLVILPLISVAYTVADIGGASSEAWLGVAFTLAVAAIAPMAGAVSDLIGRRYAALLGPCFIIIGLIVVGTAHRMDVAIGGITIAGVGGGLAETIGSAGFLELAPANSRGKYFGTAILLDIPFGAALTYGSALPNYFPNNSAIVFFQYMEMGCLDTPHVYRCRFCLAPHFLSPSPTIKLPGPHQEGYILPYRFCWDRVVCLRNCAFPVGNAMGRLQLV